MKKLIILVAISSLLGSWLMTSKSEKPILPEKTLIVRTHASPNQDARTEQDLNLIVAQEQKKSQNDPASIYAYDSASIAHLNDIERVVSNLTDHEIEEHLHTLQSLLNEKHLIQKANAGTLDSEETVLLVKLMRKQAVLKTVQLQRKLKALGGES